MSRPNLQADAGLIQCQVFYTTTDPSIGAVQNRLQMQTVQQGTAGTPVTVRSFTYASQTAFGQTIYPVSSQSVYPQGSAVTTSYAYTYYVAGSAPTFQVQQQTITYPAVPTGQNGSGIAGVEQSYDDTYGRLIWSMNQQGAISYTAYDNATGAVVQQIADVNTALMTGVPSGWTTVPGWGLHLISDFIIDSLGRALQSRGPVHDVQLQPTDTATTSIRTVQFSAYLDATNETRQPTGYMIGIDPTATFQTIGSTSITRSNDSGLVVDQIQAVRASDSGPLTTTEVFPQSTWNRWTHNVYDTWNRLYASLLYYQIPAVDAGDAGINYLQTIYGYDIMGRQNRVIQPSGTIQRMVYEARGLVVSNWTGTDDTRATDSDPSGGGSLPNNMLTVSTQQYDGGASGGDSNLTQVTQPVDTNSANDRITTYGYDYQDRRTSTTQTDGTTTWNTATTYDNQNRPLQNSTSVASGNLIAQNRTFYDLLGRVYRQETDGVDPATGSVVNTLASQSWYDLGSNVIKASPAGATSFTKTIYDALNRGTVAYLACVPGTAGVPTGDDNDVSTDTVFEQNETTYDPAGNTLLTTKRLRLDTATGTGALQNVSAEPEARVSFVATWPDAIGRARVTANYGTNGGAALTRPDVAPASSPTVLVTTNLFKNDGEANAIIDPMGLETRWDNDNAGRRICLTENYVAGSIANTRISRYAWHPSGQMQTLTLQNSVTGDQVTRWIYGTTLYNSAVADNSLLRAKIYPESDDWPAPLDNGPDGIYQRLEYTYNRQGEPVTFEDADQTVHTYAYDQLGRLTADSVTTLGVGLDNSVLRIERAYEVRGMLQTVTSYDAATGGSVVNQSAFVYDAFSNLIADQQSHSGVVVPGATPQVNYSYADGSTNTVRRTAVTYPNGRVLNTVYGVANSAADHLNQITSLNVTGDGGDLADYTYCGTNWQVQIAYPLPGVELTYIKQGSEPVGDGGDPYTGYDRFGRTIDIRWQTITGGTSLERLFYGYDQDSRRIWRQRVLAAGFDNAYTYDGLSQVTGNALGILDTSTGTITPVPAQTEAWVYDPTGNWDNYTTTASGSVALDQGRIYDQGNRLTQIESDPNPLLVDRVGRMLEVPPDATGNWAQSLAIVWDAWSRIVQVSQNGSVLGAYTYDGLMRRTTRAVSGITWHSYYSDKWRPLEERQDTQSTAAAQYLWGARHRDDLVRRDRATTSGGSLAETRYALMDYFSPVAITDQIGSVTERYAFSAFGIQTILAPDFTSRTSSECVWDLGFQGQFLDLESGFLNYGFRYYSSFLGRWLSKDPIGYHGGANQYAFSGNDPTNLVDKFGLLPTCCQLMLSIANNAFNGNIGYANANYICCAGQVFQRYTFTTSSSSLIAFASNDPASQAGSCCGTFDQGVWLSANDAKTKCCNGAATIDKVPAYVNLGYDTAEDCVDDAYPEIPHIKVPIAEEYYNAVKVGEAIGRRIVLNLCNQLECPWTGGSGGGSF
jgi:RHS repeat-associated protein